MGQTVRHRVRHAHLYQLPQPVPEGGGGDSAEADSSSTVVRGVAHIRSSVSSSTWRRGRCDGRGLATGLVASKRSAAV